MAQPEIVKDIEARVKDTGDTMTGNLTAPTFIGELQGNAITAEHFKINKITSGADLNNLTPYLYADGNTSICSTLINKPSDMPAGEISINTIPLSYNSYIYSVQTIMASNSASNLEIYVRKHHNDTFGDWKKLLTSSNYSQYALPLSGGNLSGTTIGFGNGNGSFITGVGWVTDIGAGYFSLRCYRDASSLDKGIYLRHTGTGEEQYFITNNNI